MVGEPEGLLRPRCLAQNLMKTERGRTRGWRLQYELMRRELKTPVEGENQ